MAVKKKVKIPRSHKGGLMVSMSPKRGPHIYFQKRASGFNMCIGDRLRNGSPGTREAARQAFKSAVSGCK